MQAQTGVLPLFWLLAEEDATVRTTACCDLINTLEEEQSQAETEEPCPNLSYSTQRLVKGLCSSRGAARQGFAMALVEVLKRFNGIATSSVLALASKHIAVSRTANRQEKRDYYFGFIFFWLALCRAGRISSAPHDEVVASVQKMFKIAKTKTVIREVCYETIIAVLEELPESAVIPGLLDIFQDKTVRDLTPEEIALGLALQSRDELPSCIRELTNSKHFASLLPALQGSTVSHPRVHSVWSKLLDQFVDKPEKLKAFWIVVVDEGLFGGQQHKRKYLGLLLFGMLLEKLGAMCDSPNALASLDCLFSPSLMRTFVNVLGFKDRHLSKCARHAQQCLMRVGVKDPNFSLAVIKHLSGIRNFDARTKTRTVQTLVGGLSAHGVGQYLNSLLAAFSDPQAATELKEGESEEQHRVAVRCWAVGQLCSLAGNKQLPRAQEGAESWELVVLRFLLFHGYMDPASVQKKALKAKPAIVPLPLPTDEVSDTVRELCAKRLTELLGELLPAPRMAGKESSKEKAEPSPPWCAYVHALWSKLESKGVSLSDPLDDEEREMRTQMLAIVDSLPVDGGASVLINAFRELLLHIGVLQLDEPAAPLLRDLFVCHEGLTASTVGKRKKSKQAGQQADRQTAVQVLVDILLSLLARPSQLFRNVSKRVFSCVTGDLTEAALLDIFNVLTKKQAEATEEEDSEEEVEMEVGSESDDDDEDEEEIDEDEVAAKRAKLIAAGVGVEADGDDSDDVELSAEDLAKMLADDPLAVSKPHGLIEGDEGDDGSIADIKMYDSALGELLKLRKDKRNHAKEAARASLHFQLRTLDLVDIFLRREHGKPVLLRVVPLLLDALAQSRSQPNQAGGLAELHSALHNRIRGLYRNRLCKHSKLRPGPAAEVGVVLGVVSMAETESLLRDLMDRARKASSTDTLSLLAHGIVFVLGIISLSLKHTEPKGTRKSKRTKPADCKGATVALFVDALTLFLTKRRTNLNSRFFSLCLDSQPWLGWEVAQLLIEQAQSGASPYLQLQSLELLAGVLKHKTENVAPSAVAEVGSGVVSLLCGLADQNTRAEGEGSGDRLKLAMRVANRAAVALKRVDQDKMVSMFQTDELQEAVEALPETTKRLIKGHLANFVGVVGWDKERFAVKNAKPAKKKRVHKESGQKQGQNSDTATKKKKRTKKKRHKTEAS